MLTRLSLEHALKPDLRTQLTKPALLDPIRTDKETMPEPETLALRTSRHIGPEVSVIIVY